MEKGTFDETVQLIITLQTTGQCPFCGVKPFDTKEKLEKHIASVHPNAVESVSEQIRMYVQQQNKAEHDRQQMRRRGAIIRMRKEREKR